MAQHDSPSTPLTRRRVSICGQLASTTTETLIRRIETSGASFDATCGPRTDTLVIGGSGWPLTRDGELTHNLRKALWLRKRGTCIQIMSEAAFLEIIGFRVTVSQERLYNRDQVERVIGVPSSAITRWVRQGLIVPAKVFNDSEEYNLRHVISAQSLTRLLKAGVAANKIHDNLRSISDAWPYAERTILQLRLLCRDNSVMLGMESGEVTAPSGHLSVPVNDLIPIHARATQHTSVRAQRPAQPLASRALGPNRPAPRTSDEWIEAGDHLRETHRPALAARAFQEALLLGADAASTSHKLGRALRDSGQISEATHRLHQVVDMEPENRDAWVDLGHCLMDSGYFEDAVHSLGRALELDPRCGDAHQTRARAMQQMQDRLGARHHWTRYLEVAPDGPAASQAQAYLESNA